MKAFKDWIIAHKLLSIVVAVVILVGATCAIVLPIAISHKHEFSDEWAFDGENHWHACVGKNCDETVDKALHVYENAYDATCKVCGAARTLRYQAKDKGEWMAAFDFADMTHFHITVTFEDSYGEFIRDGNVLWIVTYEDGEDGMSKEDESFYVKDGETYYLVEWEGDSLYSRKSGDKDDYEGYFEELSYLVTGSLKYSDFNYDETTHQYSNDTATCKHTLIFVDDVIVKIEAVLKGINPYDPDMVVTTTVTFEENTVTIPENHVFANTLSYDEENHWYACTDDGCNVVAYKEAHDLFTKKDGAKQLVKCRDCGYEIDVSAMTVTDATAWEKALTFVDGGYQVVLKKNGAIIEDCRYSDNGNVSSYYKNWKGDETYYVVEKSATSFDYYVYEKNDSGVWERRWLTEDYGSAEASKADALDGIKLSNYWLENIVTPEAFATFTFSNKDLMYHTETSYTLGSSVISGTVVTTHIALKFADGYLTYVEFTDGTDSYTIEVVNEPNAVQITVPDTNDFKFTLSMSKEDIIAKLLEVKNLTYDEYYNGQLVYTTYTGTDYWCYSGFSEGVETDRYFDFIDNNNRYYEICYDINDVDGSSIDITDLTGYDFDFNAACGIEYEIDTLLDYFDEEKYTVTIENGNLKIAYTRSDGTSVVILYRNLNATSMPVIPEKFENYSTMIATELAVEYSLGTDGTYSVESVLWLIKSYEVPATYNGVAVTKFLCTPNSNLTTLTLPKSITTLYSSVYRYEDDEELHIIYKGTKTEWEAIKNSDRWSKTKGVRITCSDGDYVVAEGE